MYLMDSITATAYQMSALEVANHPSFRIYPDLAQRLVGAPRFLLDNNTIQTAVELTLGRPKVLLEAIHHCRIPYPKLWVEWDETGREELRTRFPQQLPISPDRPLPSRCGFLLECNPAGRKGIVIWAWSGPKNMGKLAANIPNISPISPIFDLDNHFPQPRERIMRFLASNLASLWIDNPIQLEALLGIWRTAHHEASEWGADYLTSFNNKDRERMLAHAYADVYGEYIMVWTIMMLLTASRPIIKYEPVHLDRLNKARRKRDQQPLLDHTQVTMHLQSHTKQQVIRGPLDHTRKRPGVHLVTYYLGRRGDKHWIVNPYWRGQGPVIHRRVQVKS